MRAEWSRQVANPALDEARQAARTGIGAPELVHTGSPEQLGDADQQAVVLHAVELQVAAALQLPARAARDHERDVVERVRVAFTELAAPDNDRIVEHGAVTLRNRVQ